MPRRRTGLNNIYKSYILSSDINTSDPRFEKLMDQLVRYATGDFSPRSAVSEKGDSLDAIAVALNTLGEEAQASGKLIRDYESRVAALMEILLKYTLMDFSEKAAVSTAGDEIDAIAVGLNTMADELIASKEAEEKQILNLKKTNTFLDTILENIPNMVFVKDAKELRFVRFNKAGEKLLGVPRDQMIGKNDYDFFPEEQADFFTAKDREALGRTDVTDIKEEPIDTVNGKRWLRTKKIPLLDENGHPAYLLGISEDITERKSNEEKIIRLNETLEKNVAELEEANNELEAFTYSVSHDLRAPLRAINGYTRILSKDYSEKLDPEAQSMMNQVMSNAIKMGQLIDDLLALSRLGKKKLEKQPADMTELARFVYQELGKSTDTSKVKFILHDLHPANVDYSLIAQVFANLLSNAVKYSAQTEKPIVEVGSEQKEGDVIYYIKDNGVGFDMRYYDKLFGVFQRLHSAEEFEGTGVGLALVKRIIGKHDGKVWAESEIGKGATFYFLLKKS